MRQNTADYRRLFLDDTPMMDTRAPVEYTRGAFPHTENLPLLDDRQRQMVGTEYKRRGQQAAIDLGWRLATPEVRAQRLGAWGDFIRRHPRGYLYCFRGGLRSRTTQELLRAEGIDYPLVEGGYKAMRNFLLEELEHQCTSLPFVVIAGHTGSGKTELIHRARRAVDLEGIARHRGSSFGRTGEPQPAQIDFENRVSIELLKLAQRPGRVFIEDESRLIGRSAVPPVLQQAMRAAPRVLVEEPVADRARRIVRDYVEEALQRFGENRESAAQGLGEELRGNLGRIQKRLGGLRYRQLDERLREANAELARGGSAEVYIPVVTTLLTDYYDGSYEHQMRQREGEVLFRGNHAEVGEWLDGMWNDE
ncbi:tRNA 2-selenouridine(34) synthase MnmH [Microbulbifer halophilus]|uniref:tRNA 2-selenouridine synthase n=1 Tax=Microbulbifer halophilus TaxID=453963 RepID=A0ABW5EFK7_9GAMM|nr:tRNA 2-selenouridine(34) synthase MnmH [Microbulbifer halophilus]MCW8126478.1 tRNA 2-selenouridine(34) synthase MnmH [Microbulbifer halophilus]